VDRERVRRLPLAKRSFQGRPLPQSGLLETQKLQVWETKGTRFRHSRVIWRLMCNPIRRNVNDVNLRSRPVCSVHFWGRKMWPWPLVSCYEGRIVKISINLNVLFG
jgi:hypothetical protein